MILIKRNLLEGSSNYALQMGSLIGANKLFRNNLIEKGKKAKRVSWEKFLDDNLYFVFG